jgi:hypothetical protein
MRICLQEYVLSANSQNLLKEVLYNFQTYSHWYKVFCVRLNVFMMVIIWILVLWVMITIHSIAGKAVPQHTYGGVWGERMYSSYSFMTSALDGGEWSASLPSHTLPSGKGPQYPLYRRLGGPHSRSGYRG